LEKEHLREIINQQVSKLNNMLKERVLSLQLTKAAIDLLCERGYDRDFGARPMKRVFQRDVQNPLAIKILEGKYPQGTEITVDVEKGQLQFK
jgi:ATP-dependent Clp protease ATP-binding subunit ClpA